MEEHKDELKTYKDAIYQSLLDAGFNKIEREIEKIVEDVMNTDKNLAKKGMVEVGKIFSNLKQYTQAKLRMSRSLNAPAREKKDRPRRDDRTNPDALAAVAKLDKSKK